MLYVIFFGLLVLAGIGAAGFRFARREHSVLVRFRHHVERASAPGETVVVDDEWLAMLVHPSSSSDLKQGLIVIKGGVLPDSVLGSHEEFVIVAHEDDPVLGSLRQKGLVITEDELWNESGLSAKLPVRGRVRIYFAAPLANR